MRYKLFGGTGLQVCDSCLTLCSWFVNPNARDWTCPAPPPEAARFHAGLSGYSPTPLTELPSLAQEWGVRRVVIKDESSRLGLPAFKALGVSYAIYRVVCEHAGEVVTPATFDTLRAVISQLPPLELVTATDGNHGRALARFARLLGIPARVFVPLGVGVRTIEAIRAEQATVTVLDVDYDTAVRCAAGEADSRQEAVLVQDTAWPGYEVVPQWIVDGYSTLLAEIDAQLGDTSAALVVIPMGVGSLAQAVVTHYRSRGTGQPTALLGVEPTPRLASRPVSSMGVRAVCRHARRSWRVSTAVPRRLWPGPTCATVLTPRSRCPMSRPRPLRANLPRSGWRRGRAEPRAWRGCAPCWQTHLSKAGPP
jgi:hypothetical protein